MRFGVIVFPGSNCDHDAWYAVNQNLGHQAEFIWHDSHSLGDIDAVILPGGFSYGDYLRCGAIAKFSPVMNAVRKFAADGGLVLGICNGFQILVETGLLPGALIRNSHLRFSCRQVYLRVEHTNSPFTSECTRGDVLKIPIAHGEGNYYHFEGDIRKLEETGRVLFRYVDASGHVTAEANPNGSINNIAGITSPEGNILGMMPHPERAMEEILGSIDGRKLFESVVSHCLAGKTAGKV